MLIAFDTSTPWMTLVVGNHETVSFHVSVITDQNHSRQLMTSLEQLQKEGVLNHNMLKGIVVGLGPGSFTGVKIAIMVARSLSFALDRTLFGYSSLDMMAGVVPEGYPEAMGYQQIVPAIFHKRNEIFWSECDSSFRTGSSPKPRVGSIQECLQANREKRSLVVCPWPDIARAFTEGGFDHYPIVLSVPDARSLLMLHKSRKPNQPDRQGSDGLVPIYGSQVFSG